MRVIDYKNKIKCFFFKWFYIVFLLFNYVRVIYVNLFCILKKKFNIYYFLSLYVYWFIKYLWNK